MDIIMFDLENENGFFCNFFFLLSTYIFSQKTNKLLCIKDNKWKFLHNHGWSDYFNIDYTKILTFTNEYINKYEMFGNSNEPNMQHTLNDYKTYSKILYSVRSDIIIPYHLPETYNSIFLRGGDKLLYESVQHPISEYVSFLLKLNSNNPNVFVHSDDNLLVECVETYIKDNNIKLNVYKITDNSCNGGAVVMKRLQYGNCENIKSIDDMNNEEKREHTIKMLTAIEIMRKSENVVLSYDSNVSKFMKINFDSNVFSINHENILDYNVSIKNPAYLFI